MRNSRSRKTALKRATLESKPLRECTFNASQGRGAVR